ncbi:M3 family metallopeptidase [Demequina sediminicola]|uniref:M3 family metallopeptidase n=1 Tax=Demequina sediminicola TaxID=1095026 RepID=UPI0009E4DA85|nr:M3 family metallopeptidase [Demequina sediminicola]
MEKLTPLALPAHDSPSWRDFCENYVGERLDSATVALESIRSGTSGDVIEAWNESDIALDYAGGLMASLSEVHPEADVRDTASTLMQRVDAFRSARNGDPVLYQAFQTTVETPETRYLRELVLRDFRLAGAHLDDETRGRVAELSEQITATSTEFSDNIREDVASISVPARALASMPEDYRDAHPADADGNVTITTDYPDMVPVLDLCSDREVREALMRADYERAPANDDVLKRLLALRQEKAQLLGFDTWADFATAPMMMSDGPGIEAFLDEVTAAARPAGRADAAMLLGRMRKDHPDADELLVSDSRYYLEVLKAERFGVDAREIRQYLDYSRVRDGILSLAGHLFGLTFDAVSDAPRWHEDVEVYDVTSGDQRIGRIHLDMHPRAGKYGHMACFDVAGGIAGRHLAESALVCNFSRGKLTFDDLETFLHEFGHLMHSILSGDAHYARLAGLSIFGEWDFVEAPSQLLEEWAYSHDVLKRFAVNDAGEEIPRELVAAIRAGRDLGAGLLTCRQLTYANQSYRLHRDVPDDLAEASAAIEREFDVRTPLTGTHQYRSFGHLTTYSACYYTYQWSLAIAKDLFTGFDPDDLLNSSATMRYRDAVLVPGGSKPAAALIEDFLGRPFSPDAYAAWLASLSE